MIPKLREFNLRERAEIVDIAQKCSKSLKAQPLIDYFNKSYLTKFENGKTIADKIIDRYYPNCNDTFRNNILSILIEYIFSFEHQMELGQDVPEKEDLRELFRDFFKFHNDANENTCAVDKYFDEWYDARFTSNEKKTDKHNQET